METRPKNSKGRKSEVSAAELLVLPIEGMRCHISLHTMMKLICERCLIFQINALLAKIK